MGFRVEVVYELLVPLSTDIVWPTHTTYGWHNRTHSETMSIVVIHNRYR
jgi:hypothetical protein